jgi:putative transposase
MASPRRTFTQKQKLQILQQAQESGVIKALKQHKLSYSVFSRWKQQLAAQKAIEMDDTLQLKKEKEQLETENGRLKKIIAEQALEIIGKEEELKAQSQSKRSN